MELLCDYLANPQCQLETLRFRALNRKHTDEWQDPESGFFSPASSFEQIELL